MRTISLALYAEGATDYRFLSIIIQRTVENILLQHDHPDIGVLEPTPLKNIKGNSIGDKIFLAAKAAYGVHILFIHLDADSRTWERAKEERFDPGIERIKSSSLEKLCRDLVPVIPVKNTEAWLLCDYEAFCEAVGINVPMHEINWPKRPKMVESISDPKCKFNEILKTAYSIRKRTYETGEFYEILSRLININKLLLVPAFKKFYCELANTMKKIRIIK